MLKKTAVFFFQNPILNAWQFLSNLGQITKFIITAVKAGISPPYRRSITRRQMDEIGIGSLPIVALTGLFMGLVLALQSIVELKSFGATTSMGRPIGTTVVRELGPVLTAIMVAARSGSAITAELASMVITEQIDAMRVEGSDPMKKLVAPRVVATTIMLPILNIICNFIAFCGAWIVAARDVQLSSHFYWQSIIEVLSPAYILGGTLKALCFGFLIGTIACYCGMRTNMGSSEVGIATTRTIVLTCILILAVDFILTKVLTVFWW